MTVDDSQSVAVEKVQRTLNKINRWTRDWKIKLNELKSVHVTYALHRKKRQPTNIPEWAPVPRVESAKYLGLNLDSRLNRKHHV